ncbi:MAG TPA: ABATE domain-containing protein [Rhodothermales bacterium]|nr:ABATE domain-containing protein [Rhodothermales bacterium]
MECIPSHDASYWTDQFKVVGGNAALDFINTISERHSDAPVERIRSYSDLVAASQQIGVLTEAQARLLLEASREAPEAAEVIRRQAVALRELLYGMFSAVANGREPSPSDLDRFNEMLSEALTHLRVECISEGTFAWAWDERSGALDRMLWPFLRAAATLLVSARLGRVQACAADDCGWLFLDMSRNRSRRWCDMADCGNRAKARRFKERHAD